MGFNPYRFYDPIDDDELYHYGILGMKWGVRRYENSDGTLTPAGRDHYAKKARKEYYKYKGGKRRLKKYLNEQQTAGRLRSDVSVKDWSNTIAYDMVDHGYRGKGSKVNFNKTDPIGTKKETGYITRVNRDRDSRNDYSKPGWLDGRFNQNPNIKNAAKAYRSAVKYSMTRTFKRRK